MCGSQGPQGRKELVLVSSDCKRWNRDVMKFHNLPEAGQPLGVSAEIRISPCGTQAQGCNYYLRVCLVHPLHLDKERAEAQVAYHMCQKLRLGPSPLRVQCPLHHHPCDPHSLGSIWSPVPLNTRAITLVSVVHKAAGPDGGLLPALTLPSRRGQSCEHLHACPTHRQ